MTTKTQFSDFETVTLWWKLLSNRPWWNEKLAVKESYRKNRSIFDGKETEAELITAGKSSKS